MGTQELSCFRVEYDMTDMSMMTMGGGNNNAGGTGEIFTSMHSISTMNMVATTMSMEDMSNSMVS
jgi:hypothetical protein